jgi:hypothetical protein
VASFTPLPLYPREKSPRYPLGRGLDGPQSFLDGMEKLKFLTLPRQSVARTDYATAVHVMQQCIVETLPLYLNNGGGYRTYWGCCTVSECSPRQESLNSLCSQATVEMVAKFQVAATISMFPMHLSLI